jgi:hypothetical protein
MSHIFVCGSLFLRQRDGAHSAEDAHIEDMSTSLESIMMIVSCIPADKLTDMDAPNLSRVRSCDQHARVRSAFGT